jgi:hypothetical protein
VSMILAVTVVLMLLVEDDDGQEKDTSCQG